MPVTTGPQNDFGSHLFGGRNRRGFLGGGYYEGSPQNYELPEYGPINQRYAWGSQWAQDALEGRYGYAGGPLANQAAARDALYQSLLSQLTGSAPSVAQQQLQQTTQGNIANAFAMAQASPRNAGAARLMGQQVALANQGAAGQAALLRAQEMQQAQQGMGALRGQDIGLYDTLNRTALGYLSGQSALNQAVLNANMQYERDRMAAFHGQPAGVGQQLFGAGLNAAGGFLTGGLSMFGGGGSGGGAQFQGFSQAPQMLPMARGGVVPSYANGGSVPPPILGPHLLAPAGLAPSPDIRSTVDSPRFDTVPAMLSPGEMVLPRSIVNDDDAPELAAAFVRALKKKHGMDKPTSRTSGKARMAA